MNILDEFRHHRGFGSFVIVPEVFGADLLYSLNFTIFYKIYNANWNLFFRWIFWMNFAITMVLAVFVIVPEVFGAELEGTGARKKMLPVEEHYAYNLKVMWDFEGILRYSPIFYGYYSEKEKGAYLNYV